MKPMIRTFVPLLCALRRGLRGEEIYATVAGLLSGRD